MSSVSLGFFEISQFGGFKENVENFYYHGAIDNGAILQGHEEHRCYFQQQLDLSIVTSLFFKCIEENKFDRVRFFIENSNNFLLNIQNPGGNTALILSVMYGYLDIVKYLINIGADLNVQNKRGNTALMEAVICENLVMVKYLLENGAHIYIYNKFGACAFSIFNKSEEITNILFWKRVIEPYFRDYLTRFSIHKKNALIVFPLKDRNRFFSKMFWYIAALYKHFNVSVAHAVSISDINEHFEKRKYDWVTFFGHGQPNAMQFSNNFSLTDRNVEVINFNRLSSSAIIVLCSCQTARGLARKIALLTNLEVLAPKDDVHDMRLKFRGAEPKLSFLGKRRQDITCAFFPKKV
ncbi:MAG: hypothetical protein K1060chlam1_00361 [Candidatus Anoxychlamydiales bacterium]|nr:hypothetical protein [Candidatus Anoxychlamydiales bacterium]